MHPFSALAVILALVLAATALGLAWRARQGWIATVAGDVITPTDVASDAPFGRDATLLLFSTELCARCPGTSRLLARVAGSRPGVAHLNVDLTHRADLANRYGVMQTPTTLILDGAGRIRARIGGVPHLSGIARHLDDLTGSSNVRLAS